MRVWKWPERLVYKTSGICRQQPQEPRPAVLASSLPPKSASNNGSIDINRGNCGESGVRRCCAGAMSSPSVAAPPPAACFARSGIVTHTRRRHSASTALQAPQHFTAHAADRHSITGNVRMAHVGSRPWRGAEAAVAEQHVRTHARCLSQRGRESGCFVDAIFAPPWDSLARLAAFTRSNGAGQRPWGVSDPAAAGCCSHQQHTHTHTRGAKMVSPMGARTHAPS